MSVAASPIVGNSSNTDPLVALSSILRWGWRFLLTLVIMAAWIGIVTILSGVLFPARAHPDTGILSEMSLDSLFGIMTFVYLLAVCPMMILPLETQDSNTWGVTVMYGWLACLLGSAAWLAASGLLTFADISIPMGMPGLALALAIVFITPMAMAMVIPMENRRRLASLVMLLVAWLVAQGGALIFVDYEMGYSKLGAIAIALLLVLLTMSYFFPESDEIRWQLLAFSVLVWLLIVAILLFLQQKYGRVSLALGDGKEQFACVLLTAFVAPIIGWYGLPFTRNERAGWGVCLLVSALVVIGYAFFWTTDNNTSPVYYFWDAYNGPHITS